MRAIILCLALAACASPERRELRDGAPVRPAPVFVTPGYAPAGAGLPEYMPGPPEPVRVEPNPKPTRLLPQTPATMAAPGLWAAKSPADDPRPYLLGMVVPHSTDLLDVEHARECSEALQSGIDKIGFAKRISHATPEQRYCVIVTLFAECVGRRAKEWSDNHARHTSRETEHEHILADRLRLLADYEHDKGCKDISLADEVYAAFDDIWGEAEAFIARRHQRRLQ